MIVVQPDLPQRSAREGVQMHTADAAREHQGGDGDMTLQHSRDLSRSSGGGSPGPVQTVRVMSVVPSRYWAPESIR